MKDIVKTIVNIVLKLDRPKYPHYILVSESHYNRLLKLLDGHMWSLTKFTDLGIENVNVRNVAVSPSKELKGDAYKLGVAS